MPRDNYVRNDKEFINPYTFIPTPAKQPVERKALEDHAAGELHTGILRCRLYVRTPLGIPDAERGTEANGHKEYPFFSCGEEKDRVLMIPGSSIRGPLRSVFEAATDSCFSTLREDTGLSKRVDNRHAYKPAILKWKDGRWRLYGANRYLLAADSRPIEGAKGVVDKNYTKFEGLPPSAYVNLIKERDETRKKERRFARTVSGEELRFGDEVEFKPCGRAYQRGRFTIWEGAVNDVRKRSAGAKRNPEKMVGLVYIGETFARRKHGESVFVQRNEITGFDAEQLKKAYKGLLETLEIYRDSAINRSKEHSGYADFEHAKRETGIPVWYSSNDKKLSLAAIGRTFFRTTLNDLAGERSPCTSRGGLCEACALFGMAGDENLGSRIRITDARLRHQLEEPKKRTLQILGTPRYSYLPFYVKQAGPELKNYDDKGAEIAGRKFYWHIAQAAGEPEIYSCSQKGKMNNTLELVMPGAEFGFEIYYDGITEEQLKKLLWCLNFGENRKEGDLCHKIGHGKPLGLGSVKIVIEERAERSFQNGVYEWKHERPAEANSDLRLKNEEALRKVMDFRWQEKGPDKGVPVTYPEVYDEHGRRFDTANGNDGARHIWYLKNKEPNRPPDAPMEILPDILDKNQALHGYQKEAGQNPYGQRRR